MACQYSTITNTYHPKCNYTGSWASTPVDTVNVWTDNGECEEVNLWTTFGTTVPRWYSDLESTCCSEGMWVAGTERSVGTCIAWFLILCWIFLGVAMGADVFMTSIEVITSKESSKAVTATDGSTKKFHTRVWNATVANLTLMALGSSAPEILLNVIEVLALGFNSGELGPSTIVGSAAFNLMVITAVCIVCLPAGEKRTLKQLNVFYCTAFFSVLAYIWLYLMVVVISPEVIDVWEGVMTIALMMLLLIFAFMADKYGSGEAQGKPKMTSISGGGVLTKNGAAAVLKEAGAKNLDSAEDIKNALEEQMPPKTKAYYRRQMMEEKVGKVGVSKKAKTTVVPVDEEEGKKTRTVEPGAGAAYENSAGVIKWEMSMYEVMENGGSITIKAERVGGSSGDVTVQYKTKNQKAVAEKDFEAKEGEWKWTDGDTHTESLTIKIYDDDEYEKDEEFTVVMFEPTGGAIFPKDTDGGEEEEICTINILNDDDRATKLVEAIRMLRMDADQLDLMGDDWYEQIKSAVVPDSKAPKDLIMHILTVPWKLMFAVVPPPGICGGWPCFIGALIGIGIQVILISDFATQMGCQMYIKDSVTAITFVALGTSLPDTFASMQAAKGDKYADNSVGNVTGSNSVNVFFGLGLPWLMGSVYWAAAGANSEWHKRFGVGGEAELPAGLYNDYKDTGAFIVRKGDLGFSVIVFTLCAILTIAMILVRRKFGGQELGGNRTMAIVCAILLCILWVLYVLLSTLTTYHIIEPGI